MKSLSCTLLGSLLGKLVINILSLNHLIWYQYFLTLRFFSLYNLAANTIQRWSVVIIFYNIRPICTFNPTEFTCFYCLLIFVCSITHHPILLDPLALVSFYIPGTKKFLLWSYLLLFLHSFRLTWQHNKSKCLNAFNMYLRQ